MAIRPEYVEPSNVPFRIPSFIILPVEINPLHNVLGLLFKMNRGKFDLDVSSALTIPLSAMYWS
jgi:hypothetical protein